MESPDTLWPPPIIRQKLADSFTAHRNFFNNGKTRDYTFRRKQLKKLYAMVKENTTAIEQALYADFGKPQFEAFGTEIGFLLKEIKYALENLDEWMAPKVLPTPLMFWPSKSQVRYEPKGIALIIAPWNYPFQLTLSPLIPAIAAGNTAFLKPSEETPHTAKLIEKLIANTFDESYITVVQGEGAKLVPDLIHHFNFDHVFFTGSVPVGREIAKLAAQRLIPHTLELGGKSPAIVDETANLKVAAKRIALGKWMNAGQTCVAPDYLLLHEKIEEKFLKELKGTIKQFFGDNPLENAHYTQIIHPKHFKKQTEYLQQGEIIYGGEKDLQKLKMAPALLKVNQLNSDIMQDEIFGPVLPVFTFKNIEEASDIIQKNPDPLSLYVFSASRKSQKYFLENIRFGSGMVNGTVMHLGNPAIPFGGVGNSGMGRYHGWQGFLEFSYQKGLMHQPTWFDPSFIYPPHKKWGLKLLKWLMG